LAAGQLIDQVSVHGVDQMSVNQMSVDQMSVDQMSVGRKVFDQKTWNHTLHKELAWSSEQQSQHRIIFSVTKHASLS
jgi:hypothetical protein